MTKEKEIRGYIMRGKKDGENQDQIQLHIMLCVPGVHACRGVYAWMLSQGDRLKGMLPISMLPPPSPATLSLWHARAKRSHPLLTRMRYVQPCCRRTHP